MNTPHLDQLHASRDRLELELYEAIASFQMATGLRVTNVRLAEIVNVTYTQQGAPSTPDVKVTVELP